MEYNEFRDVLKNYLSDCLAREGLDDSYECVFDVGNKINCPDQEYLIIKDKENAFDMAARLPVEELYKRYQDGDTLENIATACIASRVQANLMMDEYGETLKLLDPDYIKENAFIQVISAATNQDMLRSIPFQKVEGFDDLAVIARVDLSESFNAEPGTRTSCVINNEMFDSLGISKTRLFEIAKHNSEINEPLSITTMSETIKQMMIDDGMPEEVANQMVESMQSGPDMFVMTNPKKMDGASVIAYEGFKKQLADRVGEDCYILPSSIHECLAVKISDLEDEAYVLDMVSTINSTQVAPKDRLSNNIYKLNVATLNIQTVSADMSRGYDRDR